MKIQYIPDRVTNEVHPYVDNGIFLDGRRKTLKEYGVALMD